MRSWFNLCIWQDYRDRIIGIPTGADTGFLRGGGQLDAFEKNPGFAEFARLPLVPPKKTLWWLGPDFFFIKLTFKVIFMYFKRVFRLLW